MGECLSVVPKQSFHSLNFYTTLTAISINEHTYYCIKAQPFSWPGDGFFHYHLFSPKQSQLMLRYPCFMSYPHNSSFGISKAHGFCKAAFYFHLLIMQLIMRLAHLPYWTWHKENLDKILVIKSKIQIVLLQHYTRMHIRKNCQRLLRCQKGQDLHG